jgi:Tfp pilus assembly protein PilO
MDHKILKRLKFALLHGARQLPLPWVLATGLLVASAVFYFQMFAPTRAALLDLRLQANSVQRQTGSLKQAAEEASRNSPAGRLETFKGQFPPESSLPDTLELLVSTAQSHDLNPKEAKYAVERSNAADLLAYQVTLPLSGPYPRVQSFVFDVLTRVRNLSLNNISFQRKQVGDSHVNATLVMTIYLQKEQP